ncbi:MAG: DUF1648 domain-containing protein, partial [Planctomycetota bacterium]
MTTDRQAGISRLPLVLFLICVAGAVGHIIYYVPGLPDQVASHFDGQGQVDGHMERDDFFVLSLGTISAIALLFLSTPWLVKVLPPSIVSMPHREYWLAPKRLDATIQKLASQCYQVGIATLV